jgi:hypothetical protein
MLFSILLTILIVIITLSFIISVLFFFLVHNYLIYKKYEIIDKFKVFILDLPEKLAAISILPDIIIFSKAFKDNFNDKEFKAILYHEMAHLEKGHNAIILILEVSFLALSYAIYFSYSISNKLLTLIIFIIIFEIIHTIIAIIIEVQADFYVCKKGFKNEILNVLDYLKKLIGLKERIIINIRVLFIKSFLK